MNSVVLAIIAEAAKEALIHEAKKAIILDVVSRAVDHGLLAEVCEAFLESDAPDDVSCMIEAAQEWDL